jgi:hypothetical protein
MQIFAEICISEKICIKLCPFCIFLQKFTDFCRNGLSLNLRLKGLLHVPTRCGERVSVGRQWWCAWSLSLDWLFVF